MVMEARSMNSSPDSDKPIRARRDVFVINTPLQLINAIEAKEAYRARNPHLVILHWRRWPRPSFEGLLARSSWNSVTWLAMDIERPSWATAFGRLSDRLAEYVWVLRRARQRRILESPFRQFDGSIDILAIGNYAQDFHRHLLHRIPHERTIALDDGTDALRAAELRLAAVSNPDVKPSPAGTSPRSMWQRIKNSMHRRWIDMDTRHPLFPVEFFSVYALPVGPGSTLRKHDFPELRRAKTAGPVTGEAFFLGQPLVEDGYVSPECFEDLIRELKGRYAHRHLLYVPHKRETGVSRSVVERAGIPLLEFTDPIELVILEGKRRPALISSFFSSAIENLRLMLGNTIEVEAIRIPSSRLLAAQRDVMGYYAYFQDRGIRVVNLDRGPEMPQAQARGEQAPDANDALQPQRMSS